MDTLHPLYEEHEYITLLKMKNTSFHMEFSLLQIYNYLFPKEKIDPCGYFKGEMSSIIVALYKNCDHILKATNQEKNLGNQTNS